MPEQIVLPPSVLTDTSSPKAIMRDVLAYLRHTCPEYTITQGHGGNLLWKDAKGILIHVYIRITKQLDQSFAVSSTHIIPQKG